MSQIYHLLHYVDSNFVYRVTTLQRCKKRWIHWVYIWRTMLKQPKKNVKRGNCSTIIRFRCAQVRYCFSFSFPLYSPVLRIFCKLKVKYFNLKFLKKDVQDVLGYSKPVQVCIGFMKQQYTRLRPSFSKKPSLRNLYVPTPSRVPSSWLALDNGSKGEMTGWKQQ